MDGKQTLKYLAFYQVLATLSLVVGVALVGLGVQMGFGDSITIIMQDAPKNWGDAVSAAQPGVFAAMAVAGVLVWQVGKTLALVLTMGKVADAAGGGDASDAEQIRSAVMSDVEDRIAPLASDVKDHEQRLAAATSDGDDGSSASSGRAGDGSDDGGRRSRRRGAGPDDDDGSASGSNRRASPGDAGGDSTSGDGD